MSVTVSADSVDEGRRIFGELSDGGSVSMPFEAQSWSDGFGMVTDRFGVAWAVDSPGQGTQPA